MYIGGGGIFSNKIFINNYVIEKRLRVDCPKYGSIVEMETKIVDHIKTNLTFKLNSFVVNEIAPFKVILALLGSWVASDFIQY